MELPDASSRPSRLGALAHFIVVAALGVSFVSGVLVWYGQTVAGAALAPPVWLHRLRVLHGFLNPLLCAIFGYLVSQHIRYGWALRANWVSGLVMEGVFLVLIVSALVVYYADEGALRTGSVWAHRLAGAGLPVVLGGHWIAGRRWVKKNLLTTCN
jgi:hypothetical protein